MKTLKNKLYETLSPEERVTLTIAALSRGDTIEVDRLQNTCERRQYIMHDASYISKLNNIRNFLSGFALMAEKFCGAIFLAERGIHGITLAVASYHVGLNTSPVCGGCNVDNLLVEADANYIATISQSKGYFKDIRDDQVNHLKNLYQAFLEMCATENLNPEHLFKWYQVFEQLPNLKDYLEIETTDNKECLDTYKELFRKLLVQD